MSYHNPDPARSLQALRTGCQNTRRPSPTRYRRMIEQEAARSGLSVREVLEGRRQKTDARARMRVWRELYQQGFSLCGIAWAANRDHTSILSGVRRICALEPVVVLADMDTTGMVEAVMEMLQAASSA